MAGAPPSGNALAVNVLEMGSTHKSHLVTKGKRTPGSREFRSSLLPTKADVVMIKQV